MPYINPHIHMISRITDDYVRMARAGTLTQRHRGTSWPHELVVRVAGGRRWR
jgi:hypothetical protein